MENQAIGWVTERWVVEQQENFSSSRNWNASNPEGELSRVSLNIQHAGGGAEYISSRIHLIIDFAALIELSLFMKRAGNQKDEQLRGW